MPHTPVPPATLRALLARADLGLSLADTGAPSEALDRPVRWVHSSDLADPTPFLSEGLVLLTTGTQFTVAPDDPAMYTAYVSRLADSGVHALGFGTEVVRAGVPPLLADACRAAGMPLFEVPYRTPFIAVARANSDAVAAEAYARRTWALAALRAISLAALRADGLTATLAELSRQLGVWVGLFDDAGTLRRAHPQGGLDAGTERDLATEVAAVMRRGAGAGSTLIGRTAFTLQTLGRAGHLRGVVAIASGDLDHESRAVVTSVIAMAELASAQNDDAAEARRMLGDAVVQTLLAGDLELAARLSDGLGGSLPTGDVVIAVAQGGEDALDRMRQWLAAHPDRTAAAGRVGDGPIVLVAPAASAPEELAELFGVRVGVSRPAPSASAAYREALAALRRGHSPVARFSEAAASGVLDAIDSDLARLVATAALAPLADHDAAHDSDLVRTVRVWLENDARIDQAAQALGVHRHTARARIATAQSILGTDLSSFASRAELWTALQLADG